MTHAISIRLPEELIRSLDHVSEATDRTKSYLVKRAIETYLAEYADYQIALDRLRDKDDRVLLSSELRKQLGL